MVSIHYRLHDTNENCMCTNDRQKKGNLVYYASTWKLPNCRQFMYEAQKEKKILQSRICRVLTTKGNLIIFNPVQIND